MEHPQGNERKNGNVHITLTVAVLLLATVMITLLAGYRRAYDRAERSTQRVLVDSASEQAVKLATRLDGQYALLEAFSDVLAEQGEIDFSDAVLLRRMNAVCARGDYSFVSVADASGRCRFSDGSLNSIRDRAYFSRAMSGVRSIEKLDAARTDGLPRFVIAVPIQREERPIGAVMGGYDEAAFRGLLNAAAYAREGYAFVCAPDGEILIASDSALYRQDAAYTDSIFGVETDRAATLDELRRNMNDGAGGTVSFQVAGNGRFAVYQPLGINDWFIFSVVPQQVLEDGVAERTQGNFMSVVIVLIFSIAALVFITYREQRIQTRLRHEHEMLRVHEEQYRIAAEQSSKYVHRYDISARTAYFGPATAAQFGLLEVMENVPESILDSGIVDAGSRDDYRAFYQKLSEGQPRAEMEVRIRNRGGELCWYHADGTTIFGDEGRPMRAVISIYDVTRQRDMLLAYEKWRQSVESLPVDKMTLIEHNMTRDTRDHFEGRLIDTSYNASRMPFDERTANFTRKHVHPEDAEEYRSLLRRANILERFARGERMQTKEFRYTEDAEKPAWRWFRISIQMVQYPDSQDVKTYILYEDIDEEKRAELALLERSEQDSLTGVLNRKAFERAVARILTTRSDELHALVMVDLDRFKQINDSLGHAVGDAVLVNVGKSLRAVLREDDAIGRIGGDEFMLCMSGIPFVDVVEKRAQLIVEMLHMQPQAGVTLSGSIGIALYPQDGFTFAELYRCADTAMYSAKQRGKDGYAFYRPGMIADPGSCSSTPIDESSGTRAPEPAQRPENGVPRSEILLRQQTEAENYRLLMEGFQPALFCWNVATGTESRGDGFSEYAIAEYPLKKLFEGVIPPDAIHPADLPVFARLQEKLLCAVQPRMETSLRLKKKDGSYCWCRLTAMSLRDAQGNLSKCIGMITPIDFTREKANIQLEALINYMAGGVLMLEIGEGDAFNALYISPVFYKASRRSPDGTMREGNGLLDLVMAADRPALIDAIHSGIDTNTVIDHVYSVREDDGSVGWRHMRAVRIPYEDSELPVILAVITDITALKRNEKELAVSEKAYHIAARQSGKYMARYDIRTGTLYQQEDTAAPFASAPVVENVPESTLGRDVIAPESVDAYMHFFYAIRSGAREGSVVIHAKNRVTGDLEWYRGVFTTIFEADGTPDQAVVTYEDITRAYEWELARDARLHQTDGKPLMIVADGSEQDRAQFLKIFQQTYQVETAADGQEALSLLG